MFFLWLFVAFAALTAVGLALVIRQELKPNFYDRSFGLSVLGFVTAALFGLATLGLGGTAATSAIGATGERTEVVVANKAMAAEFGYNLVGQPRAMISEDGRVYDAGAAIVGFTSYESPWNLNHKPGTKLNCAVWDFPGIGDRPNVYDCKVVQS